jgi:Glycine-zipper domain
MKGLTHAQRWTTSVLPLVAGPLLAACAPIPTAPHVMALPGSGKSFDQFDVDDGVCRNWAGRQIGISPNRAATEATMRGAAVGTLLGAATGAAIGAAAGNPAMGAAAGAGIGLLGGTSVGASNAQQEAWSAQRRYDIAYVQCMYAKGNQVPVRRSASTRYRRPPPPDYDSDVPPPPYGAPPPPPPGVS